MSDPIDTSRLSLLLNELRLPAIKHLWPNFTERSDKEGWPGARLLIALAEHEVAERGRRRIERHLGEAKLTTGEDVGELRLRCGTDDLQSASLGAVRRRRLA